MIFNIILTSCTIPHALIMQPASESLGPQIAILTIYFTARKLHEITKSHIQWCKHSSQRFFQKTLLRHYNSIIPFVKCCEFWNATSRKPNRCIIYNWSKTFLIVKRLYSQCSLLNYTVFTSNNFFDYSKHHLPRTDKI